MDIATIAGIISGTGLVLLAIFMGGGLSIFFNVPSLMITVGGTIASTLISFPLPKVLGTLGVVKNAFMHKSSPVSRIIDTLVDFATRARREGILALEADAKNLDDAFLQKGIQLAVDGTTPEIIKEILTTDLAYLEDRHKIGQSVFLAMGTFAPAFGMIGTLIGLIQMLRTLNDPSTIGAGMAVALLTTFYGALMANLIFLPIAGKLKMRTEEEALLKEVMIEGILSIQSGDNPRIVEEKLKAFISPRLRGIVSKKSK